MPEAQRPSQSSNVPRPDQAVFIDGPGSVTYVVTGDPYVIWARLQAGKEVVGNVFVTDTYRSDRKEVAIRIAQGVVMVYNEAVE
jgi:hypothetical protein